MKNIIRSLYIIITTLSLVGCDNYVEIPTEGKLVPEETENFRYLLNNVYVLDRSYASVDLASDDIVIRDDHANYFDQYYGTSDYYRPYKQTYKWADSIQYTNEEDYSLNVMYTALYYANVVIDEVMDSKNGTEAEKLALKGEAQVHRAFIFLTMVNIFGKAYDSNTSANDPGIPMFTTPTVEEEITRATVQEVYDQVISDLTEATQSGLNPINSGTDVVYPSEASAYALLSRAYLYMGKYQEALDAAERTLAIQDGLLSLEDYTSVADYGFPRRDTDPEIILSKMSGTTYQYSPTLLSLSDELLNSFEASDLRYQLFTRPISDVTWGSFTEGRAYCHETLTGEARNAGPTVPEVLLIKAECLARTGDISGAMATINTLRQKRFTAEDFTALTAENEEEALIKVLEERRRELMCRAGFRWFDLKRLNKDPRFAKTITHSWLEETYTLEPGADRYQFPFASILFTYAPDLEQNP
ncbi:RagB/SusD family nutrient uptake outer membrane protein [Robertkochia solimangrovi]|uniref:RagB/SusD family nutrient uptake outer membrane protein n=1 Tax=Robertkochia solimangrovi TaxID=2213046 RepID=UPI00117F7844|nr:RagB/SusD family nutrient uptake outer membrane protein [Robertkochia solimangrovi]TRZ41293.1 RagB/SusD family nutrient uptake outer membrane protein [Robertkochia solimangrovi]